VDLQAWKQRIQMQRTGKDQFFASHPQSPIPREGRQLFTGLQYYPPDAPYRFELPLHEREGGELTQVADTSGEQRQFWRWGEFRFQIGESTCTLQAYRSDSREERLFLPFKDQTNGEETYEAGRYLDLDPQWHLTDAGLWIVDFNEAYNPWCAYSKHYACPFVPPENWLHVPIPAGEKSCRSALK